MTPSKQHAFIKKVKDITIGSTIALSLFGPAVLLQSCSSNQNDEGDYEEVEVYKKGVKTYISETSKGVFKITKEVESDADSSVAYVTYLDGKQDTLSPRAVKALIDQDVARHPQHIGQSSSLSNALLYGGMGYFLGKTLSPSYSNYRPDLSSNGFSSNSTPRDTTNRHRYHSGSSLWRRYYVSQQVYNSSQQVHHSINTSRTTFSRPLGGRSGFFRSSSHGGFHG